MRVLDRLGDAWRALTKGQHPADVQAQETRFGGYMYAPTSAQPDAGPLRETEEVSAIVSRCVNVISRDAARGQLIAQDMSGDEPTDLPADNPYTRVFLRPNPNTTPELFTETTVSDLAVEGNSFWWQEWVGSAVQSIWRIPPEQVEVLPGKGGGRLINGYRWHRLDGTHEDYEPGEVMHFKTRHPTSAFRGLGHVARLRDSLLLEKETRNWRYWFFKNGVPATILLQNSQMGNPSESEIRRLRASIHDQITGERNSGHPLVLSSAWDVTAVPRPTEADVAFIKTMQFTRAEIAMMFGVPPTKLSDYSDAFRANANEQVRDYWFDTVMGWNRIVLGFLNHIWVPAVFPNANVQFAFDYTNIDAIQANKKEVAEHAAIGLSNAGITPAEFRQALGYPAPDADTVENFEAMHKVYLNGRELGSDPLANLRTMIGNDEPADAESGEGDGKPGEEGIDDEEKTKLASSASASLPSRRRIKISDQSLRDEVIQMASDVSDIISEIVRIAGEQQLQLDGIPGSFNVTAPSVLDQINTQSILVAEHAISTTVEGVRLAIARGHELGLPVNSREMRELVQAAFPHHEKQRWQLDRISRTEVHQAQESGGWHAAVQNGIEQKMWVTTIDGKERDQHKHMDGMVLPINEPFVFDNGAQLMFPGDVSGANDGGDVINCRCSWVSVLRDDNEKATKATMRAEDVWIEKATTALQFEAIFTRFLKKYFEGLEERMLEDLEELRAA